MRIYTYVILLAVLSFVGCQQEKGITISGNIPDASNLKVHLYNTNVGQKPQVLMSKPIDGEGNFEIKFPSKLEVGVYNLRIGNKGLALALDGSESNVEVKATLVGLPKGEFEVTGSALTDSAYEFLKANREISDSKEIGQKLSSQAPLVQYMLSGIIYKNAPEYAAEYTKILSSLKGEYGDIELTENYGKYVAQQNNRFAKVKARENVVVGKVAPEIALPNPEGKEIKLSDYRGKLVLLDFWAAWCGPCRANNPKLVKLYNKYKSKGFDILSVSLDGPRQSGKTDAKQSDIQKARHKEKWLKAIEKDQLNWDGHVSDLKAWASQAAADYGVESIPRTFLINKEGVIIAVNPHSELEDLIKSNL